MALRPNAVSFTSGAGGPQPSASAVASKPTSYPASTQTPAPSSSTATQSVPNKTFPRLPAIKIKGSPRGNQSKRGQAQRKPERKSRITEDALVADLSIEAAMQGPVNRRGQISMNHLLNFSIASREHYNFSSPCHYRRGPSYGIGSGHHPADKARFIQANHRFVVRPNGDYRPQSIDPDAPIPWDMILQILVSPHTHIMACPICLAETPVSPRMTACGHIACLPCFLRYFASEDVATGLRGTSLKFRKCPICWDNIQLSECKPVRWYATDSGVDEENVVVASEPREGFDVAMRLFMRKPGTTLALPRDDYLPLLQAAVIPEGDVPWHYVPEILHYAWIVKGSGSYMHAEAAREIDELEKMQKDDETAYGEDGFWTQKAIQRIRDQSELYDSIGEGPARLANLALSCTGRNKAETVAEEDIPYHLRTSHSATRRREMPYFFYQPRSASHFYLSSLDIRILKKAYGEYENFPSAILARVEHIASPQTIDDDFRRKIRYLGHLPSGCQVSFLECDWSEIVESSVLEMFSVEIDKRRRLRREKLVREEKERESEERQRRFGRRGVGSSSAGYEEEDTFVGPTSHDSEDVKWVIANAMASVQAGSSPDLTSTSPGLLSTSVDPSGPKTVWGTPRVASSTVTPTMPSTPKQVSADADLDEPGESGGMWAQDWEEMLKAVREASKNQGSRKKKGKKLVLMSNSVPRGI